MGLIMPEICKSGIKITCIDQTFVPVADAKLDDVGMRLFINKISSSLPCS